MKICIIFTICTITTTTTENFYVKHFVYHDSDAFSLSKEGGY